MFPLSLPLSHVMSSLITSNQHESYCPCIGISLRRCLCEPYECRYGYTMDFFFRPSSCHHSANRHPRYATFNKIIKQGLDTAVFHMLWYPSILLVGAAKKCHSLTLSKSERHLLNCAWNNISMPTFEMLDFLKDLLHTYLPKILRSICLVVVKAFSIVTFPSFFLWNTKIKSLAA